MKYHHYILDVKLRLYHSLIMGVINTHCMGALRWVVRLVRNMLDYQFTKSYQIIVTN